MEIPLDYNGEDYTGAAKPRRRRRRVAGRTSSAVDEILREMSLCTSVVISDEEIDIGPRRESEVQMYTFCLFVCFFWRFGGAVFLLASCLYRGASVDEKIVCFFSRIYSEYEKGVAYAKGASVVV